MRTKENSTTEMAKRNTDLLRGAADDLIRAVDNLSESGEARRAAGRKLARVKRSLGHGRFLAALALVGIPPRRAARAILAHRRAKTGNQIRHQNLQIAESAVLFDGGIHG